MGISRCSLVAAMIQPGILSLYVFLILIAICFIEAFISIIRQSSKKAFTLLISVLNTYCNLSGVELLLIVTTIKLKFYPYKIKKKVD